MKLKKISIIIFFGFFPSISLALLCPSTFNQINLGYTMEQVIAQCGNPTMQTTREVKPEVPQEWNYFVVQNVATQTMTPSQGTLKTQMMFDASGKLINISVNGIGVGSTSICGSTIQLGDNRESIKKACGTPAIVNKQNTDTGPEQPPKKITEFFYKTNPPVTLIFENGLLIQKQ